MALKHRVHLIDAVFDAVTLQQATNELVRLGQLRKRCWVMTVNVAILVLMRNDDFLRRFAARSRMVLADGQPLVWASRLQGRPLPERVTGIDLLVKLCERAAETGLSVFFLGSSPGVATEVASRLRAQFPELIVAGTLDGHFPEKEDAHRARTIRASRADILFVGMGVPRQEQFIANHWESLGVTIAVPVGGTFDVLAGRLRRAPRFFQRAGLEWTFRLAQEPRRLLWRYLSTNSLFLMLAARALISRHW